MSMSVDKIKSGCFVVISLVSVVYSVEDVKATTDTTFSEILGNISKVNDLIQDLIMNYKQLKKMTSDLDSDFDADKQTDLFQDDNMNARIKEKDTVSSKVFVTTMFMSDDETNLEKEDKNEADSTKQKNERNKDKTQKENKRNKTPPVKPLPVKEDSMRDRADIIKPSTTKQTVTKNVGGILQVKNDKFLQPTLDTLRDIMKSLSDNPALKGDLKSSKSTHSTTPSLIMTPTSRLSRQATTFERLGSTPSKKHLEPILENYDAPKSKRHSSLGTGLRKTLDHDRRFRSSDDTNSEDKKTPREPRLKKTTKRTKNRVAAKDRELATVLRDERKTIALRKAYGDACLRLVLRKCYMACKGVMKETCRGRHMCTKHFQATFKKSAIRSCDNEFNNNSANFRVANTGTQNEDNGFVDLTRDGYLAMACLPGNYSKDVKSPSSKSKIQPIVNTRTRQKTKLSKKKSIPEQKTVSSLNILRDRYEKACQRESAQKCFKACKTATKETCAEETCKPRKKDAMVKACKKRCRQAYNAVENSDSDDSDSSSSDSKSSRKKSDEGWD